MGGTTLRAKDMSGPRQEVPREIRAVKLIARGSWSTIPGHWCGPGGYDGKVANNDYELPGAPEGALLIYRDDTKTTEAFTSAGEMEFHVRYPGTWFKFFVNDARDGGEDNDGQMDVEIRFLP